MKPKDRGDPVQDDAGNRLESAVDLTLVTADGTSVPFTVRATPTPKPETLPRTFVVNLLLLLFAGVFICFWLLAFTEYIGVVATALGLGGALVWAAFLGNIIRDDRKKQIQNWFERQVLDRSATAVLAIVGFATFLGFASMHGSVVVRSRNDNEPRIVSVFEPGNEEPIEEAILSPNSTVHILLPTPFFSSKTYIVRAIGLPPREAKVAWFERTELLNPAHFRTQPAATIRVREEWAGQKLTLKVVVRRSGLKPFEATLKDYDGRSVWVGCESSVRLPENVLTRWTDEYRRLNPQAKGLPQAWTRMAAVLPHFVLHEKDVLTVDLLNEKGTTMVNLPPEHVPPPPLHVTNTGYQDDVQEIFIK